MDGVQLIEIVVGLLTIGGIVGAAVWKLSTVIRSAEAGLREPLNQLTARLDRLALSLELNIEPQLRDHAERIKDQEVRIRAVERVWPSKETT